MKFIFEVSVNPDYPPENYALAWVEASEIIQQAKGAYGTYLHRNLNEPNKLLAIAHWESKAARDNSGTTDDPRVKAIVDSQAAHCSIRLIGEFADPEWSVEVSR